MQQQQSIYPVQVTSTKVLAGECTNNNDMQQQNIYPVQKVASVNNDEQQQQQSINPVQKETSSTKNNDVQQQQSIYPFQKATSTTNNDEQQQQTIYPVQLFLGIDLETMPLQFFHELTSFLKKRVNFIVRISPKYRRYGNN
jgi:hypothetical protein